MALNRNIHWRSPRRILTSIESYLAASNANPKPYLWTATAESILAKVARARATLTEVTNQN
ncbi:hypothetical protein [Gordonia phthalatica]|uniref:hypothetical protein n=1 Tax=Gordonia phthalatica TaxID=1136941 RepID=UPI000B10D7E3